MNCLSIVLTIGLVAHSLGLPVAHRQPGHNQGSSLGSDYQQSSLGHGSSNYGQGGLPGSSFGGAGHSSHNGGSQHQQEYGSGSQGGSSNLNVASGYSKKRVETIDTGSQTIGGGSSGFQQGAGYGSSGLGGSSGLQQGGGYGSSGLGGSHTGGLHNSNGFTSGSGGGSQFGSHSGGQKGLVVEESSGFTSINKNQGGFQKNQHESNQGSSGGHGSSGNYGSRY